MDRYGQLRATDVSRLLDEAISQTTEPWWPRWRGRLGLTPEDARALYTEKVTEDPSVLKTTRKRKEKARTPLGDPVGLLFKSWDDEDEYQVIGFEGESLMVRFSLSSARYVRADGRLTQEVARRHDLPSIMATCGGNCECATCHVVVPSIYPAMISSPDPAVRAAAVLPSRPLLPPITDEEEDQLDFALGRTDESRCVIFGWPARLGLTDLLQTCLSNSRH